jgi:spermidine/putrescine ABC transporter ATP-binding subunit
MTPTEAPLLAVRGLRIRYGPVLAVESLDLDIHRGELFVLLGGSGSGKTTLLRAIAGFVRPEAGRIALDGTDLAPLPPHRRPVNTMVQSYALFPHMTVARNIGFGLRQQGLPRPEIARRVAEMLDLVSLEAYAARRPAELSGGQQQRVALARALAPHPALLLLDEPLSALDRGLREQTRQELVRLQRAIGTSFILVTHDQEEALTMAHRIGVMRDGRLAQIGTPAEVYERPNSRFVAEFLGAANILPAERRGSGLVLSSLGAAVRAAALPPAGEKLLLAVRPERLRLRPREKAQAGDHRVNHLEGQVVERAYAGERLIHVVRLADGTLLRATQSLSDGLGAAVAAEGDAVTLSWDPEASILLPA